LPTFEYSMNSRRASAWRRFYLEIVNDVAGWAWVTFAGGQGGTVKTLLPTLRAVYAVAVMVMMRLPLIPPPRRVWTEASLEFSSC
jgi:hypothetical protein